MNIREFLLMVLMSAYEVWGFWDTGTTTIDPASWRSDAGMVRNCRFHWQQIQSSGLAWWFTNWDWGEVWRRRSLFMIAGISIDFINLTTAGLLNSRTVITAANPIDPYMHRPRDLRIWALGCDGLHNTPWRYRVWRVTRALPKSLNPEHCHGPLCQHSPRHDVAIIHSFDLMFIYHKYDSPKYHFATKLFLTDDKHMILTQGWMWHAGSGFEYLQHIYENYKIFYLAQLAPGIRDCSRYLPKWWGKFICMWNAEAVAGIQNGGPLVSYDLLAGIGAFEIRYNDDRILTYTDIRYYLDVIFPLLIVYPGEYYEYAYPQWSAVGGWSVFYSRPLIPFHGLSDTLFPPG